MRELGLENITRFIVGLSPNVAQQLHSLFVIKQQKIRESGYQSVYSYQLQLLQESEVKSAMAEALCNAPAIAVSGSRGYVKHSGADQLLDVFTVEQSHQFLAKAYDCVINSSSEGDVTMCRMNSDRDKCLVCDSYIVRCLLKFNCTALEVCEDMWVHDCDISVDLLTLLTSAASEKLSIDDCRLQCAESGEHIDRLLQSMPAPALRKIDIDNSELPVDALRLLTSAVSLKLSIDDCRLLYAESGQHIDRLLQSMSAPTLREIDIDNSELSVNALRLLTLAVSLKLSIWRCRLLCAESVRHIDRPLQSMLAPTLRKIDIRKSELSVDALRLLTLAVSEKLSIDDCKLLCAESGEHIHRLLQSMPAPTLGKIDADNSELSVDALRLLTSAVSEKLSIDDCKLLCAESGEHIDRLLQSMPAPTLREIDIRDSELPVDALRLQTSAVSEKLSIWKCRLLCAESEEHIRRLLQSMPPPTLREIDIRDSELPVDALRLQTSAVSEKLSIWRCRLPCAESGEHIDRLPHVMPAPALCEIDIRYSEFPVDALRLLILAVRKELIIDRGTLLYSGDKGGRYEVVLNTRSVNVKLQFYLKDQSGRSLTNKEAKQTVRGICPSATVTTELLGKSVHRMYTKHKMFPIFPSLASDQTLKQNNLSVR